MSFPRDTYVTWTDTVRGKTRQRKGIVVDPMGPPSADWIVVHCTQDNLRYSIHPDQHNVQAAG